MAKPRSRARRLSRVEAGQMTGMGVVRAGPAVIGQRTPFKSAILESVGSMTGQRGGSSDPFSTAFVRPTFTFESFGTAATAGAVASTSLNRLTGSSPRPPPLISVSESPSTPEPITTSAVPARSAIALLANARIAPHVPISGPTDSAFRIFDETLAAPAVPPTVSAAETFALRTTGAPQLPVEPALRSKRKRDASALDLQERENGTLSYSSPSKRDPKRVNTTDNSGSVSSAVGKADDVFGPVISSPAKSSSPAGPTRYTSSSTSVKVATPALPLCGSPRSVPMQRTPGRSFGLPDLTNRPTPTSPRLFVSRAQLLKPSPSPAKEDEIRVIAPVVTSAKLAALASTPSEAPKMGTTAQPPVWSLSIAPSSPTVSAGVSAPTNLILPTLSLFDADRSDRVELPVIEDDVSMSEAGDTSVASETSQASTATSTRANKTAQQLANLQSMLSGLQARKLAAAVPSASSSRTSRDASIGGPTRTSFPGRRSTFDSSTMPPPPVASNTARRASSIRAGRPLGSSTSAPSLHRGPQPPSSTIAASATRRRASIAASTVQQSENGRADQGSTAANRLSLGSASGGQPGAQRLARAKSCLKGVVAFVDVRTAEGDDSGMIFVDMLKDLGARVTIRPSSITTHIVYKAGKSITLDFYRQLPLGRKPHLVGIAWVVQCAELNMRVDEAKFKVEELATALAPGRGKENTDSISATAQAALGLSGPTKDKASQAAMKRRRSMEPRALAALNNARANLNAANPDDSALKASIAASIERARRKSLQYAPRVGSPLAKRVFVMPDPVEEEAEP